MERHFKFSVLQAHPDRRRGERVNVGIVVFLPDRLDIRLPESRKMQALTGHAWEEITQAYAEQITRAFKENVEPAEFVQSMDFVSGVFVPSELGTFIVTADDDYEKRVRSILDTLVNRPELSKRQRQQRINSEISKVLRKAEILATKDETIDDHKVIARFVVSPEKDVVAFCLQERQDESRFHVRHAICEGAAREGM